MHYSQRWGFIHKYFFTCWFSHKFIDDFLMWAHMLWKCGWQLLDSSWLCAALLGRLARRECCTRCDSVLGSFAVAAALLTALAEVLWQPPCEWNLSVSVGWQLSVPQWGHSAPRSLVETENHQSFHWQILNFPPGTFWVLCTPLTTANAVALELLMTVMCSAQTWEYLSLILSAVTAAVFY